MKKAIVATVAALALLGSLIGAPRAVAQSALTLLPPAQAIGSGWTMISSNEGSADPAVFTSTANAMYGGPAGARVFVRAYIVATGMTAVRQSWTVANEDFEDLRRLVDYDYDFQREQSVATEPTPAGCADMRRIYGTEDGFPDFPAGLSLCAADPNLLVLVATFGTVNGKEDYQASDAIVETVLRRRAAASAAASTPAAASMSCPPTATPLAADTTPLLDLLPDASEAPDGLALTTEAERSKSEGVASMGGTDEAAQMLDDWGWQGEAYREFAAPAGNTLPPGSVTYLNVAAHRFADAEGADNALIYFADILISAQGLQDVQVDAIGDAARGLTGAPDGNALAVLYVRSGKLLYRIGTSTNSADGNPMSAAVAVAEEILGCKPTHASIHFMIVEGNLEAAQHRVPPSFRTQ